MSSELLHIKNKSRAWEKTDTLAQKLEKKRLARLRSVKSALKQKKVTRQSAAKLRHINNRKNSRRAGKHAKFSHTENSENSADAGMFQTTKVLRDRTNKVEKGKNGSVVKLGTNKSRFKPTKTGSMQRLKIMERTDHQLMNLLPF